MTAQIHEKLIFNGKKTSMAFCPPIPENHPGIVELTHEQMQAAKFDSIIFSTACWRNYVGTWEIQEDVFYLKKIEGRYKLTGRDPIVADWFTGILRVPEGELLHYVHMGFGSVYEKEIHVKIEKGRVIATKTIDNRDKKFNPDELAWSNLPGGENHFSGDEDW